MNHDVPRYADDPATRDRIAWWSPAFAVGIPLTIVLCRATPIGPNFAYVMLGIPALLLLWATAAMVALIKLVSSLRAHTWRKALSLAVLPVAVLASAPAPLAVVHFCNGLGNVIHFEIMRSHYQSVVDSMPDSGGPQLKVFNWGGMIWASNGVVYDQSDEVALPLGKQSAVWRALASNTELSCDGGYFITPMGGHFYLADFTC